MISDITIAEAGTYAFVCTFDYDANGILKVSAHEESESGKKGSVTIKNEKGRLTEEQVAEYVQVAE